MARRLLFVFLLSSILPKSHACNKTQHSSLLSFAITLSSPVLNWTVIDCCHWEGITCNQDGWVTHLDLPSRSGLNLKGGTFPTLKNFTHLTHLNLSHNLLYGSLESDFFLPLSRLEFLDLSHNRLFGELPFSIPSSTYMVDLSNNHFHGAIPSSFFEQARNLTSFNVRNNTFWGSIPSYICLHSSPLITLLDFSFNKFSGNISRGLGKCSKLQVFHAGYNNLSGSLPEDIYTATTLEEIALPSSSLHGAIGHSIVHFTNLTLLDLSFNMFSDMLPTEIGNLYKLKLMLLHFNNLTGSLPPSLVNCTNLIELNLGFNLLEGNLSMFDFSKLSQLTKLDLMSNNFTGLLPVTLYSCKSLKALRLSANDLEGQIQPEILSLKSLSFLSLSWNRLTNVTRAINILMRCKSLKVAILSFNFIGEEVPDGDAMVDFDGFRNLSVLALRGCELIGPLPVWLSKLNKLEALDMSSNRITGSIPRWLGTFPKLFYINLGNNRLSGEIPKELYNLPMLVSEQAAAQVDHGFLELSIFARKFASKRSVQQYKYLAYSPRSIYLNNNRITGSIPAEIGQLIRLHKLDLSVNNFSGNIPDQISNLKQLETLDLSMNLLSGEIPESLTTLNFLSSLNVSYNNLDGPIPQSTQIQSFSVSSFEGNPKLCGTPLPNECLLTNGNDADDKSNHTEKHRHQILWFDMSVVLGFIVGFCGFCGPLLINAWRHTYFEFVNHLQVGYAMTKLRGCSQYMQRTLRS